MKPAPFEYHDPATLQEALELVASLGWDASVLAGGQSLVPLLNLRLARPSALVDLRRVPGLDAIDASPDGLRVGAMVRAADLEAFARRSPSVPDCVAQAIRHVGHPQIRNRTTVGGNVAHADPASELPAVLVGLEGSVVLESAARGRREVGAEDFFTGVFATAREPDEIVVEVVFPGVAGSTAFDEVARRSGDFCLAGACVSVDVDGGVVRTARVALCGVADRAVRARAAEAALEGAAPTPEAIGAAARAASEGLEPQSDLHAPGPYRAAMAEVLVRRLLRGLTEAAA